MSKKTLVIGASTNPERYSYKAIHKLIAHKHETIPLGIKNGKVANLDILKGFPEIKNVHTIALYINPDIQEQYYDYIIKLKPKRIIFNPGTENSYLEKLAKANNIEVIEGCTLVLLASNSY